MEKQQKKRIKKYVSWILIVSIVALLAAMPLLASRSQEAEGPRVSVLTETVRRGDISTHLMGGGTLNALPGEALTVPQGVKLTEYLVKNGDTVAEGDVIAKVDRVSVMTAITQIQEKLEDIAEELEDIREESADTQVKAIAKATVKAVYAAEGDDVQKVMINHGALAVLSLDGMMAVRVDRLTALQGGDKVLVVMDDSQELEGRVESNLDGILTVTVKDEGYEMGREVQVTTLDGDRIGSGELYIHSPWNAVAYSGVVSKVRIHREDTVTAGKTLFVLEDTDRTAEYEQLLAEHQDYSEQMLDLFKMYQSEAITAPCDGIVTGVDAHGAFMLASTRGGWRVQFLANAPNGEEDASYVNFVGTVFAVGLDGWVMKMNPQPLAVPDYADLSAVPMDPDLMSEDVIYTAQAPIYEWIEQAWVQVDAETVVPGDVLLFAGDDAGNFVWVIRIARGEVSPELPEETQPELPPDSTEPEKPEETLPEEPGQEDTEPTVPDFGGVQIPNFSGNTFGGGTEIPEQETPEPVPVTVAAVIPQNTLELQITVDEMDIGLLTVGQSARVSLDALMGKTVDAEITAISGTGENSGGNSKFTVTLTMDREENMLAGMTASAAIPLDHAEDVLLVPAAAIIEQNGQRMLYTQYDPQKETFLSPVAVTTGISDGEWVQILSGVEEGMEFVYAYYDTLVISSVPDSGIYPSFG